MNLDITIITVVYNGEKTIERTIQSILNQSFKNFEYIIIDGNSSDQTNAIINRYKDKFKGTLIHISESDNGIYDAMNKGISIAKGKLIGILNADDYYFIDTLLWVHEAFCKTDGKKVISGELIFKSKKGDQLLKTSRERFLKKTRNFRNGVRHPATFVPKIIYNEVGLFNTDYKIGADAELMYRIYISNYEFMFLNKPLLVMSDGGISNSKGLYKQLSKENQMLLESYCSNVVKRFVFLSLAKIRLTAKEYFASFMYAIRRIENS